MANIMFASPIKDLQKAVKKGDLGDLNPTPWAFMLGNCLGWVTYGILLQNLWIFFGNAPGFIISVWLNLGAVKLLYQNIIRRN
jgi:solute carrier family 50 protein (sugar transporter)